MGYKSMKLEKDTASININTDFSGPHDTSILLLSNSDGRTPVYNSEEVEIEMTDKYLLELKKKVDNAVKEKGLKVGDKN